MRVAADIGGTFTDLVCLRDDSSDLTLAKVPTSPANLEDGVMDALGIADVDREIGIWSFIHGSTVVINAITQRTGLPTALITTKGFRDVLEIGRGNRPDLYNLRFAKPTPFVDRHLRYEVRERIDARGSVLQPLSDIDVKSVITAARESGAHAVAICFLHSYKNPIHERRCAEIIKELDPGMLVTMSHEISMEWREYERTSTAVLNAYVQGVVAGYVESLEKRLVNLGIRRGLYMMQSNGGIMSFRRAMQAPIRLIESGPVAGVIGAKVVAEAIGRSNVISLDIGGTTAKTSLIDHGEVKVSTDYRIERRPDFPGYPLKVPVADIVEIGAGGGSIAWLDAAGGVNVGPQSAGAVPGPACYPRGGEHPTVTDANLITGRINPQYFLGGQIEVSVVRARKAMERLAKPLGLDVEEAARGVVRVANARMGSALRLVSVRRGYDPRDFDLIAFGGGGPLHGPSLARQLRIPRVIIPQAPAHFSAWGMLLSDVRADWVRTAVIPAQIAEAEDVNALWGELEAQAADYLLAEALRKETVTVTRYVDARYIGQEHTVRVPVPTAELGPHELKQIVSRFQSLHEQLYTFRLDSPLEFVNFHLVLIASVPKAGIRRAALVGEGGLDRAFKGQRTVDYDELGEQQTPIFERSRLAAGDAMAGPVIIEEPAASSVVLPDQRVSVDELGNLVVEAASSPPDTLSDSSTTVEPSGWPSPLTRDLGE